MQDTGRHPIIALDSRLSDIIAICNSRRAPLTTLCNRLSDAEAERFLMALCSQFQFSYNVTIGVYRGAINPEVDGYSITHDRNRLINEIEFNLDCIMQGNEDLYTILDAIDTMLLHQEIPEEYSRMVEMIQLFDPTLSYEDIVERREEAIRRSEQEQNNTLNETRSVRGNDERPVQ